MQPHHQTLFCRYHYDPLDRLADCTPTAQARSQRFYLKDRLATEIQGARQRSTLQHEDQLLAQQQRQNDTLETHLLATDQQRSVLAILAATRPHHLAYTPYGHRIPENGLLSLLGFNGERPDPVTGHYLLGNGYRAFNPVLMRFNSPDSWSPFGEGGLNAYGYCDADPINQSDPTGHLKLGNPWKGLLNFLGLRTPSAARPASNFPAPGYPNKTLSSIGPSSSLRGINEVYVPIFGVTYGRDAWRTPRQSIQNWINSTTTPPDKQIENLVQTPHVAAQLNNTKLQAGQTSGTHKELKIKQKKLETKIRMTRTLLTAILHQTDPQ